MTEHIVKIFSEFTGGILVTTQEVLNSLDEASKYRLGLALDFDGASDVVGDFENGDWKEIWRRETQPILLRCKDREFALAIISKGTTYSKVVIGELDTENDKLFGERLLGGGVESNDGSLLVLELDSYLSESTWLNAINPQTFAIPTGKYLVYFSKAHLTSLSTSLMERGFPVFGSVETPWLRIEITPFNVADEQVQKNIVFMLSNEA